MVIPPIIEEVYEFDGFETERDESLLHRDVVRA
jgi:hypothetical protein